MFRETFKVFQEDDVNREAAQSSLKGQSYTKTDWKRSYSLKFILQSTKTFFLFSLTSDFQNLKWEKNANEVSNKLLHFAAIVYFADPWRVLANSKECDFDSQYDWLLYQCVLFVKCVPVYTLVHRGNRFIHILSLKGGNIKVNMSIDSKTWNLREVSTLDFWAGRLICQTEQPSKNPRQKGAKIGASISVLTKTFSPSNSKIRTETAGMDLSARKRKMDLSNCWHVTLLNVTALTWFEIFPDKHLIGQT